MSEGVSKESVLSRWKKRQQAETINSDFGKAPAGADIPLSYGQQRLWFLQQLNPDNPFYNYAEAYILKGTLDQDVLIKSIRDVVDKHHILRTSFTIDQDKPLQKVISGDDLNVDIYDLSSLPENEKEKERDSILLSDSRYAFDLTKAPLMRITLVKLDEQKHILLLTMHHIITDKWSMDIVRKDIALNYQAGTKNNISPPVERAVQYADFAYWQQNGEVKSDQLAYWKDQLAGSNDQLGLATDYKNTGFNSFNGAHINHTYSSSISEKVLSCSKKLGTTPYVFMLSAYFLFLFKHSDQSDISVGTPISNRNNKDLEDMIGFFNDTVVLRMNLDRNLSFKMLVEQVNTTTLDAFANKDIPFDHVVKALKPKRSVGSNPFFQTMFLYHSVLPTPGFGPDLDLEYYSFDSKVAKFDLTLYVSEDNGQLSSIFEYATDLFHESTIARYHLQYEQLLESVAVEPDRTLASYSIITPGEMSLMAPKSEPFISKSEYQGIHQIIEEVCLTYPKNIAVTDQFAAINYAELNERAKKLAWHLIELKGEQTKQPIGLCYDRTADMIIALFAILKSGSPYIPIDPAYPKERIAYMLADSETKVVLTTDQHAQMFEKFQGLVINTLQLDLSEMEFNTELPQVNHSDLAYIIYTSGSSGRPKGVPISHENIINSTLGRFDFYSGKPSAFLLLSSIAFDSSKAGLFWTLCSGGNLVVSESKLEQDIDRLISIIENERITHTLMLPSLYQIILEQISGNQLTNLEIVIVAGESCDPDLGSRHIDKLPNTKLYNEYGPTEATVWCTAQLVTANNLKDSVPIGQPVANADIIILNKNGDLVPYGEIGEIHVGGPGLSGGYLNNKELTAEVFVQFNTGHGESQRLYKTGDLGRFNLNGELEFCGRKDQQVKIRGYRIELNEIQSVLNQFPEVDEAVVLAENYRNNTRQLINKENELSSLEKLGAHLPEEVLDKIISGITALSESEKSFLLEELNERGQ